MNATDDLSQDRTSDYLLSFYDRDVIVRAKLSTQANQFGGQVNSNTYDRNKRYGLKPSKNRHGKAELSLAAILVEFEMRGDLLLPVVNHRLEHFGIPLDSDNHRPLLDTVVRGGGGRKDLATVG